MQLSIEECPLQHFLGQGGIIGKQFSWLHSLILQIEKERQRNARALNDRLTTLKLRMDTNHRSAFQHADEPRHDRIDHFAHADSERSHRDQLSREGKIRWDFERQGPNSLPQGVAGGRRQRYQSGQLLLNGEYQEIGKGNGSVSPMVSSRFFHGKSQSIPIDRLMNPFVADAKYIRGLAHRERGHGAMC